MSEDTAALVKRVRESALSNRPLQLAAALDSFAAALERAERENELLGSANEALAARNAELAARAQKAEEERDEALRINEFDIRVALIEAREAAQKAEAKVDELQGFRDEAERLRLIEHRKMYDEIEKAEAVVAAAREVVRQGEANLGWSGRECAKIARRALAALDEPPMRYGPYPPLDEQEQA